MATENNIASGTIVGAVSGTALTVMVNINLSDLIKTAILAAVGAAVSFCDDCVTKMIAETI